MIKYLSSTDLKNISGGKSKLPIPSWSQLRDTIWDSLMESQVKNGKAARND